MLMTNRKNQENNENIILNTELMRFKVINLYKYISLWKFYCSQIRACDEFYRFEMNQFPLLLMERALQKCTWLSFKYLDIKQKSTFCGNGNNGGDGFAIARMLYYLNFDVEIYINKSLQNFSKMQPSILISWKGLSGIEIKDFSEFDSSRNWWKWGNYWCCFGSDSIENWKGIGETIRKMNSKRN